jgi:hypothetical protein
VAWQVTGNRQDPFIKANPIINEVKKGRDTLVAKGEFLSEEARRAYEKADGFMAAWLTNILNIFKNFWAFITGVFM